MIYRRLFVPFQLVLALESFAESRESPCGECRLFVFCHVHFVFSITVSWSKNQFCHTNRCESVAKLFGNLPHALRLRQTGSGEQSS